MQRAETWRTSGGSHDAIASQYSLLETGKCFKDYCKTVIALVSDQGTEHLIADCGPISAEHVKEDDVVALRSVASGSVAMAFVPRGWQLCHFT